jgi:deazaflavin-dependent oxidoreductase (nitroreductase family)
MAAAAPALPTAGRHSKPATGDKHTMDDDIRQALENDRLIDITTTGRKSGKPHKKEVNLRQLDGQPYLSNSPGPRDWAANLLADHAFTYHLKQSIQRDIPATATEVRDQAEKRELLRRILEKENALDQLEPRMAGSHLFRVDF